MNVNSKKGFSLVELMVVVAIIGIIATIAVPNFLKFQAKAKQSNAKSELSGIYTAQKAFFVEFGHYHSRLPYVGFVPDGVELDSSNCAVVGGTWPSRQYASGFAANSSSATSSSAYGEPEQALAFKCPATVAYPGDLNGTTFYGKDSSTTAADNGLTDLETVAAGASAEPTTFTAASVGVISGTALDGWTINHFKQLVNVSSGL